MYISEIQKRIMATVQQWRGEQYDQTLGFVLLHGANPKEMTDDYHIALWIEGAPLEVRKEFSEKFDLDTLRVCDFCGRWMTKGYSVYDDPYCSKECAESAYVRDVFNADAEDGKISREQAHEFFINDLNNHPDEVFWTEWYQQPILATSNAPVSHLTRCEGKSSTPFQQAQKSA